MKHSIIQACTVGELLLILLREKPDLKNILFDFGKPEKIDLQVLRTCRIFRLPLKSCLAMRRQRKISN